MQKQFDHEDGPDGATRILIPRGELDGGSAGEIRRRVEDALAAGKRCVVVDLSEVTYMESAALTALMEANARVARFGASMPVVVPSESRVRRLFTITRLDNLVHLHETREDALGAA